MKVTTMKKLEFVEFALVTTIGIIILLLAAGCIEESDPEAPTKCNKLLNELCIKVAACTNTPPSECINAFRSEVDCSQTIGVSSTYDTCMSALPRQQCTNVIVGGEIQMPTPCIGALLFEE